MYDKVSIFAERTLIGADCTTIANYLDTANDVTDRQTGECRIYGSLQGLKVSIYPNGVYIVGSLPKFLHCGSNIYPIRRSQTAEAIEAISDLLHFSIECADVTGLEVGANFVLKYEPLRYLSRLGEMPYLKRFQLEATSLYYKGIGRKQPKVFNLYDKIADAKAKGMEIPPGFEDANLLRYEMRLKGRLTKQLKCREVKAANLSQPSFYRAIVKRWQDAYFSISKTYLNQSDMSQIKTPKGAFDCLVARLLAQSEENTIASFFDELKQRGVFTHRSDFTRLRKMIADVSSKNGQILPDELIRELDDEVKNVGAFL